MLDFKREVAKSQSRYFYISFASLRSKSSYFALRQLTILLAENFNSLPMHLVEPKINILRFN